MAWVVLKKISEDCGDSVGDPNHSAGSCLVDLDRMDCPVGLFYGISE
jgi:hypothetical protein